MNPQQPPGYPPLPPQPPGHAAQPSERKWLVPVLAGAGALVIGMIIGVTAGRASSPPGRVVVEHDGLLTVSASATVTVTPAAAARPAPSGPGTTMGEDGTSGVYVVGQDIKGGTWHTSGAIGGSSGDCYVALLSSTDTNASGAIIDNDNVTGPDTITVGAGVKAVQVSGCETWYRTGP